MLKIRRRSHVPQAPEAIEAPRPGSPPIICIGKDWEGDPTSNTHFMRLLSRRNRVLWVNSIGTRRPGVNRRDLGRLLYKFRRAFDGCAQVAPNMHVFNPLVVPFPELPGVARFNSTFLSAALRRTSERLGFERPLMWTYFPTAVGLVGRLRECAVIYHCIDDYAEFPGVNGAALRRAEQQLLKVADLVVTSSEILWRERRQENPRTFFIPHGVDVDHFSRALDPGLRVHLADSPKMFVEEIERALGERSEPFLAQRLHAMRAESWESRVGEVCRLIRDTLGLRLGLP